MARDHLEFDKRQTEDTLTYKHLQVCSKGISAMATVQFSIRIDPDIKARLDCEAQQEDRSASYLAQKAIDEYLKRQEYLRHVISDAEAEAEKGLFVSGQAVHAWIASWDSEAELPEPQADIFPPAKSR